MYDEPTAGLDPVASTVVEDLVRSLHEPPAAGGNGARAGGISAYIVVTHQHSTIRRSVDRLIFLHQARRPTPGLLCLVLVTLASCPHPVCTSTPPSGAPWTASSSCTRPGRAHRGLTPRVLPDLYELMTLALSLCSLRTRDRMLTLTIPQSADHLSSYALQNSTGVLVGHKAGQCILCP